jgi:NAD(P)-dependent dehydrogenase (short-subunit alcohol dehydrogenase family)
VGVVIASRGKAAATAALKELAGAGGATWQPVDVADGKSVARLITTVMAIIKQTPRGTIGEPAEIAAAVLWLCSEALHRLPSAPSWPSTAATWREPLQGASGARA